MQNMNDKDIELLFSENLGNIDKLNNEILTTLDEQNSKIDNINNKQNYTSNIINSIYNKLYNISSNISYLLPDLKFNNKKNDDVIIMKHINDIEVNINSNNNDSHNDINKTLKNIKESSKLIGNVLDEQNNKLEIIKDKHNTNTNNLNNNFTYINKLLNYYL